MWYGVFKMTGKHYFSYNINKLLVLAYRNSLEASQTLYSPMAMYQNTQYYAMVEFKFLNYVLKFRYKKDHEPQIKSVGDLPLQC